MEPFAGCAEEYNSSVAACLVNSNYDRRGADPAPQGGTRLITMAPRPFALGKIVFSPFLVRRQAKPSHGGFTPLAVTLSAHLSEKNDRSLSGLVVLFRELTERGVCNWGDLLSEEKRGPGPRATQSARCL